MNENISVAFTVIHVNHPVNIEVNSQTSARGDKQEKYLILSSVHLKSI